MRDGRLLSFITKRLCLFCCSSAIILKTLFFESFFDLRFEKFTELRAWFCFSFSTAREKLSFWFLLADSSLNFTDWLFFGESSAPTVLFCAVPEELKPLFLSALLSFLSKPAALESSSPSVAGEILIVWSFGEVFLASASLELRGLDARGLTSLKTWFGVWFLMWCIWFLTVSCSWDSCLVLALRLFFSLSDSCGYRWLPSLRSRLSSSIFKTILSLYFCAW